MGKWADDLMNETSDLSAGKAAVTGFSENFGAGVGQMFDEESSTSAWLQSGKYEDRNRKLDAMINKGDIDFAPYVGNDGNIDYPSMAYDKKREGVDIMDDDDVGNNVREELAQRRVYREGVFNDAEVAGIAGMFLGMFTGASLDPINAAFMLAPPLIAAKSATAMGRAAHAAVYYGASGVASEGFIQYAPGGVRDWKSEIGVDYSHGDAFLAIGAAGIGSAALGTVAHVAGEGIRKAFKKIDTESILDGFDKARTNIRKATTLTPKEKKYFAVEIDKAEAAHQQHVLEYRRAEIIKQMHLNKEQARLFLKSVNGLKGMDPAEPKFSPLYDETIVKPALFEDKIARNKTRIEEIAEENGYDTDLILYRGTNDIENEVGTWFSTDPKYAEHYSNTQSNNTPNMYKAYIPKDGQMVWNKKLKAEFDEWFDVNKDTLVEEDIIFETDEGFIFDGLTMEEHFSNSTDSPIYMMKFLSRRFLDETHPDWTSTTFFEPDFKTLGHSISYNTRDSDVALHYWATAKDLPDPEPALSPAEVAKLAKEYAEDLEASRPVPETPDQLDVETRSVADNMDKLDRMAQEKVHEPDQTDVFRDFDEQDFSNMDQGQRDDYLAELLGEETNLEDMEVLWETGQIDGDGNPLYESRIKSDIDAEIEENIGAMDDFIACMSGIE